MKTGLARNLLGFFVLACLSLAAFHPLHGHKPSETVNRARGSYQLRTFRSPTDQFPAKWSTVLETPCAICSC